MDLLKILALLDAVAKFGGQVADLVDDARLLNSTDEDQLRQALANLQARNNVAYDRIQRKLDAAAKR